MRATAGPEDRTDFDFTVDILCWLLGTSVQEIGMLHTLEQASLPKHV